MSKHQALKLLGGSKSGAAAEIGITYQAIDKWPDELPRRLEDRVLAALVRRHMRRYSAADPEQTEGLLQAAVASTCEEVRHAA